MSSEQRLALLFPYGGGNARVRATAPDGSLAVELTPDRPCAQFDAEAGVWVLEARRASADVEPEAIFVVSFDELYDY